MLIRRRHLAWLGDLTNPLYAEYRDDRFVAAIDLDADSSDFVFAYLVRAVTPGTYGLPAEDGTIAPSPAPPSTGTATVEVFAPSVTPTSTPSPAPTQTPESTPTQSPTSEPTYTPTPANPPTVAVPQRTPATGTTTDPQQVLPILAPGGDLHSVHLLPETASNPPR